MRDNSPFQPQENRNREINGPTSCPGHTARLRTSGQTHRGRDRQREAPCPAGRAGDPCSKPPSVSLFPGHWTGSTTPGATASRLQAARGWPRSEHSPHPYPAPATPACVSSYSFRAREDHTDPENIADTAGNPGSEIQGEVTQVDTHGLWAGLAPTDTGGLAKGISTDKAHRGGHAGKYFREIFYLHSRNREDTPTDVLPRVCCWSLSESGKGAAAEKKSEIQIKQPPEIMQKPRELPVYPKRHRNCSSLRKQNLS